MKRANSTLFATYVLIVVAAILTAPAMAGGKNKGAFDCPDGEAVIGFDDDGIPKCSEIFPPEVPCPCWTMQTLVDTVDAFNGEPGTRIHREACTTIPLPVPESVEYRLDMSDPSVTLDALTMGTVNGEIGNEFPVLGDICHITILGNLETQPPNSCQNLSADHLTCEYSLTDAEFDSCNGILRDFAINTQGRECIAVLP